MKAAIFRQHGGPEVLEYTDVPAPQIRANEVLVEVKACALNHLDIFVRNGLPGIEIPLPHILGCDVAGIVREVGELVTWVKTGDEVKVDLRNRRVDVLLPAAEMAHRRQQYQPPVLRHDSPWQELYRSTVGQLDSGAVMELAVKYRGVAQKTPRHNH